ncbi:MAG: hypothetical protein JXA81_15305 [Sedimentisphaerales bacterium]|nr:hypothetical protein [Sedimentisphaerales bacterium]
MTKAQKTAYRLRHIILVAGILFTVAGIVWAILPLFFDADDFAGLIGTVLILNKLAGDSRLAYGINVVIVLGLVLLAQWAFLRPGKGWTVRIDTVGRPLKTSVFAAGVIAMLLTVGFVALLLELPNLWEGIMSVDSYWNIICVWIAMLIIWGVWSLIFFVYWRQGDRYTQLGKMIRGLVAGSILEIIIAVPVHIWATRQRECYCCRGTYTTLVLAATVLIWAFGPGIVLLYMREKRRIERLNAFGQD